MNASAFLLFIACTACAAAAQPTIHRAIEPVSPCYDFDKAPVSLQGTMFSRIYFGSPNYGENPETDGRDTAALLLLDAPICVNANSETFSQGEFNVVLIQLAAIGIDPKGLFAGVGHRVEVSGPLFHSMTAHHRTPVLVEVNALRILD